MKTIITILLLISFTVFSQDPENSIQFTGVNFEAVKEFCPKIKKIEGEKFPRLILIDGKDTVSVFPMFWIVKKGNKFSVRDPYKK